MVLTKDATQGHPCGLARRVSTGRSGLSVMYGAGLSVRQKKGATEYVEGKEIGGKIQGPIWCDHAFTPIAILDFSFSLLSLRALRGSPLFYEN